MFSKKLVAFSLWIDHTRWARNTWALAAIFVLTMAVIADMVWMRQDAPDSGTFDVEFVEQITLLNCHAVFVRFNFVL